MSDSTRIADLPENITMKPVYPPNEPPPQYTGGYVNKPQAQGQPNYSAGLDIPNGGMPNGGGGMPNGGGGGIPNMGYVQMNMHPNPYGNGPPQHGSIGLPQQTHVTKPSNNPYISQTEQPMHMAHLPQHQLPSRDIPQDTASYYQDSEITPNYIPPAKNSSDFVKEYEETYKQKEQNVKTRDKTIRTLDDLFVEFRITIIVSLLFLLFQSPIFHTMVLKHFTIFAINNADGNLNIHGLLLKSAMFGGAFYFLEKIGEYVR